MKRPPALFHALAGVGDGGGDPDQGLGPYQPGGWGYALLPFTDQQTLWDLAKPIEPEKISTPSISPMRQAATRVVAMTPIKAYYCPSRRAPIAYPGSDHYIVNAGADPIEEWGRNRLRHEYGATNITVAPSLSAPYLSKTYVREKFPFKDPKCGIYRL